MDIKGIIEKEFGLTVKSVIVIGEGLDSIAYVVNNEYIFKQSKHNAARINLKMQAHTHTYMIHTHRQKYTHKHRHT